MSLSIVLFWVLRELSAPWWLWFFYALIVLIQVSNEMNSYDALKKRFRG